MMLQVSLLTFASQKSSVFVTWLAVEAESNLSMSSVLFCIFSGGRGEMSLQVSVLPVVLWSLWQFPPLFLSGLFLFIYFYISHSFLFFILYLQCSSTTEMFSFQFVGLLKLTQKSCVLICIKKGEIYRFICWCCWFFSFFLSCGGKTEKGPKISFILQKYFFYGALPH